jgi:NAD(P)-dependent dehydrogenase (short-subunit alcohol dehydrogenase family)
MQNAMITGASSGIGKAIYDHLLAHPELGYIVFGLSRRGPDYKIDLNKERGWKFPLLTNVGLIVNCAGIMPFKESRKVMNVNFWGTYNVIQNLLPECEDGCCIINISSVCSIRPDKDLPIYGASKTAIVTLTKALALQLAYPRQIRVNCISPGFYKTNLVLGTTPQNLIDTIPLGYEDEPKNLIPVVEMLIKTPYITGANIIVDGGVSL